MPIIELQGLVGTGQDAAPAINQAIASMSHGTLQLLPGAYVIASPIVMKTGIILKGAGLSQTALVQADPNTSAITAYNGSFDFGVEGLGIHGQRNGMVEGPGNGIFLADCHDFGIDRVQVVNHRGIGFAFAGCARYTLSNFLVIQGGFHGVWAGWSTAPQTDHFSTQGVVRDGTIYQVYEDGIEVHRNTIIDNVTIVFGGYQYPYGAAGIYVMPDAYNNGAYGNVIRNCDLSHCSSSGIDVGNNCRDNVITGTRSYYNFQCGLSLAGPNNRVADSAFVGNGLSASAYFRSGVMFGSETGMANENVLSGNLISSNGAFSVSMYDNPSFPPFAGAPCNNLIQGNHLIGTPYQGPWCQGNVFVNNN